MTTTTSKLSPTVFLAPGRQPAPAAALDADVTAAPAPLADAAPENDADLISGISLTFVCMPLGGATAARGFEPFVLP